jgi:hypothetical protein
MMGLPVVVMTAGHAAPKAAHPFQMFR